jgi:hypothetical protein
MASCIPVVHSALTHACKFKTSNAGDFKPFLPAPVQVLTCSTEAAASESALPMASLPRLTEHANKKPRLCSIVYVCRAARVFAVAAQGRLTASHVGVRDACERH